jgi:putative ABC transport system permease protein
LFGLAALASVNRAKEIGIRKVCGASMTSLTALLSYRFLVLICIAILIATPVTWYLMQQWLSDFAYRIEFPWWTFVIAGVVAVVIAFVTISMQSMRAAMSSPVKSLRSE